MNKKLSEMTLEELWQLFPIILTEHKPYWKDWYQEEISQLKNILPANVEYHHIGSTAINDIWAKPIIDILVVVESVSQLKDTADTLQKNGYIVMSATDKRISLNKGYTQNGFAERVFHLHLRLKGDTDEIYFRDYLNTHPDIAKKYEELKLQLWKKYEHNRDAYTDAKADFVKKYTDLAKESCHNPYMKHTHIKKKKITIGIVTPAAALILVFLILCITTMSMYSPMFLGRVLTHWDSSVADYKVFPERTIQKSDKPYTYEKDINASLGNITVNYKRGQKPLSEFINSTDTTSFIIVKNNKIIYEQYANGYDENSINTSFSMAKSIVSLLIGKAIENGYIKSVDEPIANYISEFENKEIGKTTIEDLLLMRSNIVYDEDKFLWFGDDTLTYWSDDLRTLALSHTQLTDKYDCKFHYNNYHPLLLGIILERSTGMSVSQFFEREIWQKIGAEYDASWSLDSNISGFEKMESGINFHAIDFVKIGSMVLHDGYWNGTQVVNGDWLNASTLSEYPINEDEYENTFLSGKNIAYRYMWYNTPSTQSDYDIIAWGKSDQILYVSPANDMVILRTGKTDGGVSNWVETIKDIISEIQK